MKQKMKNKGMAKGGMKKGYAAGGLKMVEKDGKKVPFYAADGKGKMNKGGMAKGMAKGGMKKKAYAKGGKVMTYNVGGMVKSQGKMNTGIRMAKGGAMGGMKKGMK